MTSHPGGVDGPRWFRAARWSRAPRWFRAGPVLVLMVTAAVGAGLALGLRAASPPPPGDATGTMAPVPAPPLAGTTLAGEHFDLADARGQVLLVNVFASWCGPCRDELPLLVAAERRWSGQGLRLVGLNVRDGNEAVRALLDETGARDLTVLPDPDGTRAIDWGVRGMPETFVLDRTGRIVARQRGAVTARWLEQRVPPLLATT